MRALNIHSHLKRARCGLWWAWIALAVCQQSMAIELAPNDLVVGDFGRRAVFHIDPASGNRTILSGLGVGTGPTLVQPRGMAIDRWGQIYVADPAATRRQVVRIDPITGNRVLVSGDGKGSGKSLVSPFGITLDSQGELYVTDRGQDRDLILHIDIRTGNRTVVSSSTTGSGPIFGNPIALTRDTDDSLLVGDQTLDGIFRVDRATGNRSAISAPGTGVGPAISSPFGLALAADGFLLVSSQTGGFGGSSSSVIAVDPATGNRQTVSSSTIGGGPSFADIRDLAIDSLDNIYVVDEDLDAVFRVSRSDGTRDLVSDALHGSGTTLLTPDPMAAVGSLELAGDYNGNHTVDAADYAMWRDRLGSSHTLPGDVTPGLVSSDDYDVWHDNFGRSAAASGNLLVVPEPTTGSCTALLVVWWLLMEVRWRFRHPR